MAAIMQYVGMVDEVGEKFLSWVNPILPYDTRVTKDWFGTSTSFVVGACLLYIGLVCAFMPSAAAAKATAEQDAKKAGSRSAIGRLIREPVLMVQFLYNLIQVTLSTYMFVGSIMAALSVGEPLLCMSFVAGRTPIAKILWVFYMSKLLDCCDTMFMCIRNKRNQVSFLHVYHHVGTMLVFWASLCVAYDADIYIPVLLNSFVHIIMYGYYAITSLGVSVPLFIKSCVTRVQIVQFWTMLAHSSMLAVPALGCGFPRNMVILYTSHIVALLLLFSRFFAQQYRKKTSSSAVPKKYQ